MDDLDIISAGNTLVELPDMANAIARGAWSNTTNTLVQIRSASKQMAA